VKTLHEINEIHRRASEISIAKRDEFQSRRKTYKDYLGYENVLCVFQTHNKAHLLKYILEPFLKRGFKNIVLFADGCQDTTLQEASALLGGKCHAVIGVNDLHEIANYRTAIHSELAKDCRYLLLMQDDDIYPDDFGWLETAMSIMEDEAKLVVIGFAGGQYFIHQRCKRYIRDRHILCSQRWHKRFTRQH